MGSVFQPDRFLREQEYMYDCALSEVKHGKKYNHWMWYVFPQLKELAVSVRASYFAIDGIDEARAYLAHPILGARLRKISSALLELPTDNAYDVFGHPDHLKLQSCMTLFAHAADDNRVFFDVLAKFFDGAEDRFTLEILGIDR